VTRFLRTRFSVVLATLLAFSLFSLAQTPETPTSPLKEVRFEVLKTIPEAVALAVTGLQPGSTVSRKDLQASADRLVQSGFFTKVSYEFRGKADGVAVTYHLRESPRIPAYFDNFPWFSDGELGDAIRKKVAFYDGSLPEVGDVLDQAADALNELLASRGLQVTIEHSVTPSPFGEGNVQEYRIQGAALRIARIDFSDPAVAESPAVEQHVSEVLGKPYSRLTIDLFLTENVRPLFLQKGLLRAKLGPPEVRLTGNPNQKLPEEIPVYIPVSPGPVYHWKNAEWSGNSLLSSITLASGLGIKPGEIANGMAIEAAWDNLREEYGRRGYLEAKIDPTPSFDDQAHTISYSVKIDEGKRYVFGTMVLTGLSVTAERRLRAAWPIQVGETFDKTKYEDFLTQLQLHPENVFGDLPLHYDNVGHWLKTNTEMGFADVLLDFR